MTEINKITYEEFIEEFLVRLKRTLNKKILLYKKGFTGDDDFPGEMVILTNEKYFMRRSKSLLQDFILVIAPGDQFLQDMIRLNVEALYKAYQAEGWNSVMNEVRDSYRELGLMDEVGRLIKGEEEWPKEKLILRPINYTDNKYQLREVVYWRFRDIALVLYFIVEEKEGNLCTMKMRKKLLESAGLDEETMMIEALLNTNLRYPPRIYDFHRYENTFEEGQFMSPSYSEKLMPFKAYRLTTANIVNGAIAIFYPGVKEKIAELIGGDYYVAFTSIHDAAIHSVKTFSARLIGDNVKDLNRRFGKEDYLSNRVFRYYADSGKFE